MSLQSNFPKTRKYYFWAIFLCYLISVDAGASEAERKLFGTLAYRMISKAGESVPQDPVCYNFLPLRSAASRRSSSSAWLDICLDIMVIFEIVHTEGVAEPSQSYSIGRGATVAC